MTIKQQILKTIYHVAGKLISKSSSAQLNKNKIQPITSFYLLKSRLINGQIFSFDQLKNKKVLIVNTASDCLYTAQYETLQILQDKYKEQLVVIGFPSNEFGKQEKADNLSIENFCKMNYGVDFPLMQKSIVKNAQDQHEVYQWLTDASKNGWNTLQPEWNFCKYLVDENGMLVGYFGSSTSPLDKYLIAQIEGGNNA
ncbi:MAG: glutathione peroxidase [Bacteroidetes bacterium]|nr:glutathione peroxidase [Bacteroidota bacterium]